MKRLAPYKNWTPKELKHTLKVHVSRLDLEEAFEILLINVINEAFDSLGWNIINDYNGCTLVQDEFHPCPACFVHDYAWLTGHGGVVADRIFYHLMIAEGMNKGKAKRRWFAVRVGWFSFYMWKYIFKKKFMKPSPAMIELDNYFKNN